MAGRTSPIRYADKVDRVDAPASSKQVAPAAERNKGAILDILRQFLAPTGTEKVSLLEVASGTGQHAYHFVSSLPGLTVQPSDMDAAGCASIDAYRADLPVEVQGRMKEAVQLDVLNEQQVAALPPASFDALLCCNMVHISPPECTPALLSLAATVLRPGGTLLLYGPYLRDGQPTTESNAAFDAKLKGMDARYGLRDLAWVTSLAASHGLHPSAPSPVDMPAHNFTLLYTKKEEGSAA